jgi:hypothetical protein
MTQKITYRRLTTLFADGGIKIENERGVVTHFSDALAYSAFVHGLDIFRGRGIDVTLYDEIGAVIIGDVTDPNRRIINDGVSEPA